MLKYIRRHASQSSTHDRVSLVRAEYIVQEESEHRPMAAQWHDRVAFFTFGLTNNFPFVVMLSAAEDILSRNNPGLGTGVVLLADIIPDLVVKATLPFFMQRWSFKARIALVATFNFTSFVIVAFSTQTWMSLLGVAAASLSSGLGEITFLALTSYYSQSSISSWSSGTGAAGLLGSLAYLAFTMIMSPSASLLCMLFGPALMVFCYAFVLNHPSISSQPVPRSAGEKPAEEIALTTVGTETAYDEHDERAMMMQSAVDAAGKDGGGSEGKNPVTDPTPPNTPLPPITPRPATKRTPAEYAALIRPMLPYMVPLLAVYLSAYLINQGIYENVYWNDEFIDKDAQYRVFQTLYRLGVFIARSSASLFAIDRVWIPASLECVNLIILLLDAQFKILPSIWMWFVIIVYEGLLAGATYVHAFLRISRSSTDTTREFCMGFAAVSGSVGIAVAGGTAVPLSSFLRSVGPR